MQVFVNGELLPQDQARIDIADAGLQHGVGLFETMAAWHGRVFRLGQHLARLEESSRILGLARQLDRPALAQAVAKTLAANNLQEARVRLTITAGSVSLLRPGKEAANPGLTVLVVAQPPTEYDPAYFQQGITAVIAAAAANPYDPLAGHKTLAYWSRLRTLRQAAAAGAGEAIWLNVSNHLASGSVSNVFVVRGDQLHTPFARGEEVEGALPAPVLPGITRGAIFELAAAVNLPVQKGMLSVNDLLEADEVFLTNSSWLVLPVTKVEKKAIGNGQVGPVTRQLRQALLEQIAEETGDEGNRDPETENSAGGAGAEEGA